MTEEKSPFELDDELEYVDSGRRFLAAMVDGVIIRIVLYVLNAYLLRALFFEQSAIINTDEYYPYMIYSNGINIILGWLYYALMESSPKQATLGKMAFRARVTDEEGNRISFGQATGRYFSKILSAVILFVGFLMILWDKKQQGLHDKIAKTVVVY